MKCGTLGTPDIPVGFEAIRVRFDLQPTSPIEPDRLEHLRGRTERYAIASLAEAGAYLDHPLLGFRLRECTELILASGGGTAEEMLGAIDAMKLRSCMTLFWRAAPDEPVFRRVLDRFYGGVADEATDMRLATRERAT